MDLPATCFPRKVVTTEVVPPRGRLRKVSLPATCLRWNGGSTEVLSPGHVLEKWAYPQRVFVETELLRRYSYPGHVLEKWFTRSAFRSNGITTKLFPTWTRFRTISLELCFDAKMPPLGTSEHVNMMTTISCFASIRIRMNCILLNWRPVRLSFS